MKRLLALGVVCAILLSGCANSGNITSSGTSSQTGKASATGTSATTENGTDSTIVTAYMPQKEESFTERDLSGEVDETSATYITFGDSIEVSGQNVKTSGKTCVISAEGTYIVKGTSGDARIEVKAGDKAKVQIVLSGCDLTNQNGSVIYAESAKKLFITMADGTENKLSDTATYTASTNEDGVIFSKADITLNGKGTLIIAANYAHGIVSKDDLTLTGASFDITSVKSAFSGKDCIKIADGKYSVTAGTDAFKSENADDTEKGYIYIYGGEFSVHAEGDGFSSSSALMVSDGKINITTSTGSESAQHTDGKDFDMGGFGRKDGFGSSGKTSEDTVSAKGMKADSVLYISGGTVSIDSLDDALHSNGALYILGGDLDISAGDDGLHADTELTVTDGILNVKTSYEGIEAQTINIDGGSIILTASDDGINANGDEHSTEGTFTVSGGYLNVTAGGDGLDSNGYMYVKGGTIMVSGPENSGNGALDYGAKGVVTGGVMMICGSSGMAQNFGSESTQCTVLCNMSNIDANTRISCIDEEGNIVVSFVPVHMYSSVLISSPDMEVGKTYTIMTGGSCDSDENGFATSGTLNGGTSLGDITLTKTASTFGSGQSSGRGRR